MRLRISIRDRVRPFVRWSRVISFNAQWNGQTNGQTKNLNEMRGRNRNDDQYNSFTTRHFDTASCALFKTTRIY